MREMRVWSAFLVAFASAACQPDGGGGTTGSSGTSSGTSSGGGAGTTSSASTSATGSTGGVGGSTATGVGGATSSSVGVGGATSTTTGAGGASSSSGSTSSTGSSSSSGSSSGSGTGGAASSTSSTSSTSGTGGGTATGSIFALHWDNAAMVEHFGTVDVTTAAFSSIATIPGIGTISGEVVLDPVARTYSFVGGMGNRTYVTIDLDSGAVVSSAPLSGWFNYPEYDAMTGDVFALHWDGAVEQFGKVDVTTATFTPIATIPGIGTISGEVVLDPVARTYSFVGGMGSRTYVTIDLDSGVVISSPLLSEWFNYPEYDPMTGNVFALHWDDVAKLEYFGTVDVTTATFSPIAPLPSIGIIGGNVVLEPITRTYSFVGGPGSGPGNQAYVTVDIDSGVVISSASLSGWFDYPQALY